MTLEQLHWTVRAVAEIARGLGHKPDKKLLRFNDIVYAVDEAARTITRTMPRRERHRLFLSLCVEMTEMCFLTIKSRYIPGKGPLYELEQYRMWDGLVERPSCASRN